MFLNMYVETMPNRSIDLSKVDLWEYQQEIIDSHNVFDNQIVGLGAEEDGCR